MDISNTKNVVSLAFDLIDIESITENEAPVANALEKWLKARRWIVERQIYSQKPLRYNILSYPPEIKDPTKDIDILFNSHIDCVPPHIKASYSTNEDGKAILCGRGACDTKSIIASQLVATQRLYKEYNMKNIALLYVIGEEVDHCGMKYANKLNLNPRFLIVGEPTESRTVVAQKGAFKIVLKSKGKAAHSSLPHLGIDAIGPLMKILYHFTVIERWPKHDIIGDTTVNIGLFNGGAAANIIPADASASVYFRTACDAIEIEKRVKDIIKFYDTRTPKQISYEILCANNPSMYDGIGKEFKPSIVGFNTDIPYFKSFQDGKLEGTVLYGPGSITVAHADDEHIIIDELKESVENYVKIVKKLMSGNYDRKSKL